MLWQLLLLFLDFLKLYRKFETFTSGNYEVIMNFHKRRMVCFFLSKFTYNYRSSINDSDSND